MRPLQTRPRGQPMHSRQVSGPTGIVMHWRRSKTSMRRGQAVTSCEWQYLTAWGNWQEMQGEGVLPGGQAVLCKCKPDGSRDSWTTSCR